MLLISALAVVAAEPRRVEIWVGRLGNWRVAGAERVPTWSVEVVAVAEMEALTVPEKEPPRFVKGVERSWTVEAAAPSNERVRATVSVLRRVEVADEAWVVVTAVAVAEAVSTSRV